MAEKQAGGLNLRIGLTLSQLQSDFLAAEQTIRQGMANLNRQQNLVKIRMDADITGLDAVADKTKILEIRERGLTQLLEMQRDKLTLATAAYKDYAASKGANDVGAKKLETAMERERLAVARLEAELKNLSSQKVSIDTAHVQDSIAKLTARIKNIKIQAEIDTSRLKDAGSIFDAQKVHIATVTRELELQRQKYAQLQVQIMDAAKNFGGDSSVTLNVKTNALQQYQEIQRLEQKLKELQGTDINLKIRVDNLQKAEQTINERIARINAAVDLIRVKTEVDTSKLSGATAEFDKAKAHVSALNQELTLQNKKLVEMQRLLSQSSGTKAINLAADVQRQIQAIDQLKAKIKELNSIQPPKSGLLSEYLNIKGDITGQLNNIATAFGNLRGATSSADNAIVSVLGVIDSIPSPVGKAITALAGLPVVFAGIENSVVDMMKATTAAGDATYVMSRGFQMSVADTGKFTTMCKTAGVEVNDLASTLKRVQQSIVRGGEDAKAEQWLKRYGESAFDANGKLKDLNEMTLTLSRALKRAQEDGNGMAFILGTMRSASADAITAIEDAEGVYEQASHIVKAGLANPALAHEVQGNLNALNVQTAQFGTTFKNALLPVANEIVPRMTERMGHMTQLIKDNKDIILDFGRDFAQVWGNVEDTVDKVSGGLGVLAELARENRVVRKTDKDTVAERYKDDMSVQSAKDILEREIAAGAYSDEDIAKLRARGDLYLKEIKRIETDAKSIWAERRKAFAEANQSILDRYKNDDSIKTATDLFNKLTDAEKEAINNVPSAFGSIQERSLILGQELQRVRKEAQAAAATVKEFKTASEAVTAGLDARFTSESDEQKLQSEKAQKYYAEAADVRAKTKFSDYEYQRYSLYRWKQEQLAQENLSATERLAIEKDFQAKLAALEQERETKLAEIRDRISSADKTSFENRLADIEKEKQSWIQAGMDKLEADELAQKKREQLEQEIADKVSDIRQSINAEFQTDLEKQISAIQKEQQAWLDMGVAASESAELAGQKMELAFEKAVDKAKTLNQSLEDKIFAQEHSQYENDVRKLQHEVAQKAQEYQKAGLFDENARAKLNRYYNNALRDLNVKAAKGGDYTKAPAGANSGFQLVDYSQAQQQAIGLFTKESTSRQSVIKSLDAEQRKRLEEAGVLDKIIDAQNSLANSTEQAAGNIQDASSSIEIIHGDQIGGQDFSTPEMPSLDDILAGVIPTNELRELQSQTQEVTNAQGNLTNATENVTSAEKNLSDATNDATTAQKNFAETTEQVKSALKKIAEDAGKLSGSKREDTDVPTKMPTKSAPHDNSESKPEKVQLKVKPKEKELSLEDLGIDYDTFKDILLTGGGIAAGAGATGIGSLSIPAILGGTVLAALAGGVAKGTYDNYQEKQSIPENISLDAGEFANVDLTEISSPLSGIETNVQGIRDILQGRNAVEDANTESLQDTSTENFPDLLTPLTNINETAQSLLQELQSRQDEGESDTAVSELQSEISSRLSESASQITDGITAPIESLSQALSEIQAQNSEQDTAANEGTTYLENVAGTVQRIWDDMQAAKETETADAQGTDDTAAKLANIDTNVAAIWQKLSETTAADMSIDTPQDSGVARLVTIDEKVQGILTTLQDKAASQESPLNTLLEPLQRIDSPLSSIVNAITEKKIEMPVETLVKPLDTISGFVSKIADMLSKREPPKVEISPQMDIDLGGAYVFDDRLKSELVNDITSNIVSKITEAVERATASISRSGGYGFGS